MTHHHSASGLSRFARRVRLSALGVALSALHLGAHADLWTYVDDKGITHFAASQVDERYQLFYKGSDAGKLNLTQGGAAAAALAPEPKQPRVGLKAKKGEPKFEVPRRFANIDSSKSYKNVQKHMRAAAKTHQVDYELLKAVIAAESGFDPEAVSPKGAVGLMQLMPPTAQQYGVVADRDGRKDRKGNPLPVRSVEEKLTDPQININAGARYLAYLIKLFKGELELAVAAYNAGEGAVQRAGNKIPNYKETQGYVRTVMGLYGVFKPDALTTVASSSNSSPLARAVSKVGGRVRVELGGGPAKGRATPADTAGSASAPATDAAWVPVVYRKPDSAAPNGATPPTPTSVNGGE